MRQLIPQIWANWHRHSTESLSAFFFLAWAVAGIPLGIYNIVDDYNIALQIQPNVFILLSLITWSQCKHYGDKWSWSKTSVASVILASIFGGIELGLVFALRLGRDRGHKWPSTLMAIVAGVLLAGGVLRHYVDVIKTRSDAGMSLKFALLDASGDLASLISVVFQPHLKVLGLVIYGSELAIWLGLIVLLCCFRVSHRAKAKGDDFVLVA